MPDPANPQSLNRYAYSYNNPLRYTDPSGHNPIAICMTSGACQQFLYQLGQWADDAWAFIQRTALQVAPAVTQYGMQWSQYAQEADAAGKQPVTSDGNAGNGGNTANPNPNDPWFGRALTEQEVRQFTTESTHFGSTKTTLLGHFRPPSGPNYIEAATQQKATYFNLPENLRTGLSEANQWELNKQFLRDAVARGDRIIVGTEMDYSNIESWLFREINFLRDEYHLILRGGVFVPE